MQKSKFKQDILVDVNGREVKIGEIKNPELNQAEWKWKLGGNTSCPDCERIINRSFKPVKHTTAK